MTVRVVTFGNLFPSALLPQHGLFVRERMRRVVAGGGFDWSVVSPVPIAPWFLRRGEYATWARMPREELVDGVSVLHPRYRHWPGLSFARQATKMAAASLPVVTGLLRGTRAVLDAHYVYPDGVAAARVAARLGLPFTITARGSDLNVVANDARVRAQIVAAAGAATALFGVSSALCARFAEVTGLPRERIRLARNGVDTAVFRPGDATAARAELGLPREGLLVLGVGRLVAGKGFHLLREAITVASAKLVLVGDGPERARLAAELPADKTVFLGALPPAKVAVAYRACDLFVLPSEREGWPNVVTEALASGLPVVATEVGGIPQILEGSRFGKLVPPGDRAALQRAIAGFLAEVPSKEEVRRDALRWSWDEPVALLRKTFTEALAG